jgi:hypothetical protein
VVVQVVWVAGRGVGVVEVAQVGEEVVKVGRAVRVQAAALVAQAVQVEREVKVAEQGALEGRAG